LKDSILLSQDLTNGCGGKIWEAANVMINYFIGKESNGSSLLQNKKIVEVGSGTGLVGLAMAKLCPSIQEMLLTDQLSMMGLLKENITLNKLESTVKAEILNWGEDVPSHMLDADVILASDCIYLEVAFIPLIETLFALTAQKPNETVIYLAYRKRRSADKRFFQLAKKKFIFEEITDDPQRLEYQKQKLHLFIVRRKNA
ncbi:nicotinamide N-methyltransferase-like protein, partial [Mycotypha africana]|uniref:nicotinamide N-methyltransferase-like protein n=1 Tax=Mycotypha africana TaxID=64632 RepID=UPI0022FFE685